MSLLVAPLSSVLASSLASNGREAPLFFLGMKTQVLDADPQIRGTLEFKEYQEDLEEKLREFIPPSVLEGLKGFQLNLAFNRTLQRDGIFVGYKESSLLQIEIHPRMLGTPEFKAIFTHELFHALHFAVNPDQPSWIREGLAQVFEWKILNRLNSRSAIAGLEELSTSLVADFEVSDPDPAQYGHAFWYFYYLSEQCGGSELFWELVISTSIDGVLKKQHPSGSQKTQCESFQSSYRHFEIARAFNRIRRDLESDQKVHFLFSTSVRPKVISFDSTPIRKDQLRKACRVGEFCPVLVEGIYTPVPGYEAFYLTQSYPHSVSTEIPPDTRNWKYTLFLPAVVDW